MTAAPVITILEPNDLCNLDSENCGFIMIVGGPFVQSDDLECVFVEMEVSLVYCCRYCFVHIFVVVVVCFVVFVSLM